MNYDPSATEKLTILLHDYEMFGLRNALRHALAYWLTHSSDDFDERYGVSTDGIVPVSEGEIADPGALASASDYGPTRTEVLRHMLRYVVKHFDLRDLTFIDLGCGKGRALFLAAEWPFREVIGVEVATALVRDAERNLANVRKARSRAAALRSDIRICLEDATRFDYPASDLLIYMFNPFDGPALRAVLDRLTQFQARHGRRVHLLITSPESEALLHAHPAFTQQHEFQVINLRYSWSLWRCRARDVRTEIGPRESR